MALSRRFALLFVIVALMPLWASAQQEDALRAAIRADIMADPRSSEMSPTEIDALVEALAVQAEEQGTAAEYLESESTFEETAPAPVFEEKIELNTLSIAIAVLLLVLAGATAILVWHRRNRIPIPPAV
jgi:hypothetical protein